MDQTAREQISYNVVASLWYRESLPTVQGKTDQLQLLIKEAEK